MSDADSTCPVCKSTSYLNPSLKLVVSPCYHIMCVSCVDRIFGGGAAPCPMCQTVLRRSNFAVQFFEDLQVEKECRIRKMISKYMNKLEEDFPDATSYDDYLEQVEAYTFRLLNSEDVQQVYEELESFRSKNAHLMAKNVLKQNKEDQRLSLFIEKQNEYRSMIEMEDKIKHLDELQLKRQENESLLRELEVSDKPAAVIAENKRRKPSALLPASSSSLASSFSTNVTKIYKDYKERKDALDHGQGVPLPTADEAPSEMPAFDPLEGCYSFPVSFDLLSAYYDPIVEGWIDTETVRAGGSLKQLFQTKAIQAALATLLALNKAH